MPALPPARHHDKGAAGKSVPNPAATATITATTAVQWARDESKTVNDFMTDPAVSYAGLGIQCEQCHGTGVASATEGHTNTGVKISSDLETLGQSQVCGQCHGSYTNLSTTLGIYGYTTNLAMRDFVDINGVTGGQSYTKIPTEDEFARARRPTGCTRTAATPRAATTTTTSGRPPRTPIAPP